MMEMQVFIPTRRAHRKTERRHREATLDCMNSANLRSSAPALSYLPLAVGYLLPAISASAHPGHSLNEATPGHLLTSPDHLTVLALGGVALWFAGRFVQRQLPRRLLQGAGVAAILTAAAIWGVRT